MDPKKMPSLALEKDKAQTKTKTKTSERGNQISTRRANNESKKSQAGAKKAVAKGEKESSTESPAPSSTRGKKKPKKKEGRSSPLTTPPAAATVHEEDVAMDADGASSAANAPSADAVVTADAVEALAAEAEVLQNGEGAAAEAEGEQAAQAEGEEVPLETEAGLEGVAADGAMGEEGSPVEGEELVVATPPDEMAATAAPIDVEAAAAPPPEPVGLQESPVPDEASSVPATSAPEAASAGEPEASVAAAPLDDEGPAAGQSDEPQAPEPSLPSPPPPAPEAAAEGAAAESVAEPAAAAAAGGPADGPAESAAAIVAASLEIVAKCAEEAAVAAEEDKEFLDATEAAWNGCEASPLLDAALGGADDDPTKAPVRLVDARFLISLAKADGRLVRRQDLPDSAFFDLPRLRKESFGGTPDQSLRLLICLMPFLADDHPDPHGLQLQRLARALSSFVEEDGGSYGVYLRYCSLHQPGLAGEGRTAEEAELYARALQGLPALYSHEATPVLELSSLPPELDESGAVAAAVALRGWSYWETSITKIVKPSGMLLDLSKFVDSGTSEPPMLDDVLLQCKATRPPPVLPDEFGTTLAAKSFSDPADLAALTALYGPFFDERFAPMDALLYDDNEWQDAELAALCKVLSGCSLPNCTSLWLSRNDLGDDSMKQLTSLLEGGAMPLLEELHLHGNPKAAFKLREEVQAARAGLKVHYDGMGGGRTNHKQ